jgi:hypothetical protein
MVDNKSYRIRVMHGQSQFFEHTQCLWRLRIGAGDKIHLGHTPISGPHVPAGVFP